jgi:uncharacterized protein
VTDLCDLPELGVGFIYWPAMQHVLEHVDDLIDVLEVEPQPFWFSPSARGLPYQLDTRAFDHLRALPHPKLVHGVGFPIGGLHAPDPRQIVPFAESIRALGAPWASEHLSFNRVKRGTVDLDVGFLLPPVQSAEGVAVAAANITSLMATLPVPFAFETGVSYLRPWKGELSDGQFFAAVATEADCGILLDLHNVWANELNGRQRVLDLVDELPLDRVIEVHLAGGQDFDGYWVDAHSDIIPPALIDLAERVIPRLPNLKAIVYEVMPEYVAANGISNRRLFDQFRQLRELWDSRGSSAVPRPKQSKWPIRVNHELPSPQAWELALSTAVTSNRGMGLGLIGQFRIDPGTDVLRRLIGAVRAGKVAAALTLTTRLLLLTIGEGRLQALFEDFWAAVPSEQMTSDEARNFAAYIVSSLGSEVQYLRDVANFEVAAHRAVILGESQRVEFSVDPAPLLDALRQGRLPAPLECGNFELKVPPGRAKVRG